MTVQRCEVSKEIEFDAGHRVMHHGSKCRNPHGHRYRVRVTCSGDIVDEPGAPDDGMLVDFGDLKNLMTVLVHDELDHSFIYQDGDPLGTILAAPPGGEPWKTIRFPYAPTAENLARWCWAQLDEQIAERFRDGLRLVAVTVWETPTSTATYRG